MSFEPGCVAPEVTERGAVGTACGRSARRWPGCRRPAKTPSVVSPTRSVSELLGDSKPIFGPASRRRRLPWWLIPVAAVVGLAILAGTLRSETREVVAYLDQSRVLLVDQAPLADAFEALLRVDLRTIQREDFDTLLDQTELGLREAREQLETADVPDTAVVIDELLRLSLESWETGVDSFSKGVLSAADLPTSQAPVQMIEEGILQLRIGDTFYARFLERSREIVESVDVTVGEFPEITFAVGEPTLRSASTVAAFVRSSSALGVITNIAITSVVFDPSDTGAEDDGAIVFPVANDLLIGVTVSNIGNQDAKGLVVDLAMFDSSGVAVATLSSDQLELAPGEATSAQLGPVAVSPGERYQLTIRVPQLTDEADVDNNLWNRELIISPP